ncbi:hypothetical protein ACJX0J_016599, partial [Zea mays]
EIQHVILTLRHANNKKIYMIYTNMLIFINIKFISTPSLTEIGSTLALTDDTNGLFYIKDNSSKRNTPFVLLKPYFTLGLKNDHLDLLPCVLKSRGIWDRK